MNDAKNKLAEKILAIKKKKKMTWPQIAKKVGMNPVWTTAALLGQMSMLEPQAKAAAKVFGLSADEMQTLMDIPYRGSLPTAVPTDPLVYRFYELVSVYGTTWKELIQEEFGDGIMSAIDYEMTMERLPDPKGDRVKIVMHGKFLPYRRY
jgi:cyanate lyase